MNNTKNMSLSNFPYILMGVHVLVSLLILPIGYWSSTIGASILMWERLVFGAGLLILFPTLLAVIITLAIAWIGNSYSYYFPKIMNYVYWFSIPLTIVILSFGIMDLSERVNV